MTSVIVKVRSADGPPAIRQVNSHATTHAPGTVQGYRQPISVSRHSLNAARKRPKGNVFNLPRSLRERWIHFHRQAVRGTGDAVATPRSNARLDIKPVWKTLNRELGGPNPCSARPSPPRRPGYSRRTLPPSFPCGMLRICACSHRPRWRWHYAASPLIAWLAPV